MVSPAYSEGHSTPSFLPWTESVTLPLSPPSLPSTPLFHPLPSTHSSISSLPSHAFSTDSFISSDGLSPSLHSNDPPPLLSVSCSTNVSLTSTLPSFTPCSSCSTHSSFLSPPLSSSPSSSPSLLSILETDHPSFAFSSSSHSFHPSSHSSSFSSSLSHSSWSFPLTPTTSSSMLNYLVNDLLPLHEDTSFPSFIQQANPQKKYIQTLKHRLYNSFEKIAEKVNLHSKLNTPEYLEMAKAADTIVFLLHQSVKE